MIGEVDGEVGERGTRVEEYGDGILKLVLEDGECEGDKGGAESDSEDSDSDRGRERLDTAVFMGIGAE